MGTRLALFWIIEADRLQFRENCAHENLCVDAKDEPLGIVCHPDCGTTKFLVRLQFEMFSYAFELQIKLDRIVSAGAHGSFFSSGYGHSGQVRVCCRVNSEAIDAPLFEGLTAEIKHRGVQIEQVRQCKVARSCLRAGAFPFGSCSSHSAVGESEMGSDFF